MLGKMEKMHKEFEKFMKKRLKEGMTEKEIEQLINEFQEQYDENFLRKEEFSENEKEIVYDYLDLAFEADTDSERVKYAKKVLKLDKDNLDAEYLIASATSADSLEMLKKLEKVMKHGNEIMEREKYFDEENIGHFWGIFETRPYMRIKCSYANTLVENGMMKKAIKEYEEILKLNENDNMGVRFRLMSLYAFFEDEENALKLYKKYGGHDEVQILLPLSVLYFKKGESAKAANYLKKIEKNVKGIKKFFKDIMNDRDDIYLNQISDMRYRRFTTDELMFSLSDNEYLFGTSMYVFWAYSKLGKKIGAKSKKVVKLKK